MGFMGFMGFMHIAPHHTTPRDDGLVVIVTRCVVAVAKVKHVVILITDWDCRDCRDCRDCPGRLRQARTENCCSWSSSNSRTRQSRQSPLAGLAWLGACTPAKEAQDKCLLRTRLEDRVPESDLSCPFFTWQVMLMQQWQWLMQLRRVWRPPLLQKEQNRTLHMSNQAKPRERISRQNGRRQAWQIAKHTSTQAHKRVQKQIAKSQSRSVKRTSTSKKRQDHMCIRHHLALGRPQPLAQAQQSRGRRTSSGEFANGGTGQGQKGPGRMYAYGNKVLDDTLRLGIQGWENTEQL